MSKKLKIILSFGVCLVFVLSIVFAMFTVSAETVTVELDGKTIDFDVKPMVIDGRTMVPVRKIFEEIGAFVKWNEETQTVSARKSAKTVSLTIDSNELTIDKGKTDEAGNPIAETVELDVSAKIVSDRTLVPTRAVSEAFGLNVEWDDKNNKVIITSDKEDDTWKENKGEINLSDLTFSGEGVEINGNDILITKGGDYTVFGTLSEGNITVSSEERVKLRLSGVSITSLGEPCIYIENADKAFITVEDNSKNNLTAKDYDSGAVYSKDNLEIKGGGELNISSMAGHGIKASDNLTVEGGNINIEAFGDGIHINDTFKMIGGNIEITATGDGIDSESIVSISGGKLNIKTEGEPKEVSSAAEEKTNTSNSSEENKFKRPFEEKNGEVEFEKSSKGINAEWLMSITGGDININSASHSVHCADEISISGGTFALYSEYEKGISAHGNMAVSGDKTVIDIEKSTEGIESKNVLTINGGTIDIIASDDGINATGGNSGDMHGGAPFMGGGAPPDDKGGDFRHEKREQGGFDPENRGGEMPTPPMNKGENKPDDMPNPPVGEDRPVPPNMGERDDFLLNNGGGADRDTENPRGENRGGGRSFSDCLIINGGDIEIFAGDDCLDSNGNLIINGGVIKAVKTGGSFSGANGVLDSDGKVTIGEEATLILAAQTGAEESMELPENSIVIYCDGEQPLNTEITLKSERGEKVLSYAPKGPWQSVLISSKKIETGKRYKITVGDKEYNAEISDKTTTFGEEKRGVFFGDRRKFN